MGVFSFNGKQEKANDYGTTDQVTDVPIETDEYGVRTTTDPEDGRAVTDQYQEGLQRIEAVAIVWTKYAMITAYVSVFILFFINSLEQQTDGQLTPYVTSAFELHSLVSTTNVLSSIIGGVVKLPVAKVIDVWGRTEGYLAMVTLTVVGLVMMAACQNVETYAAAQVFYWVGHNGMAYVLDVFLADTSSLRNRAWVFAFTNTPYIATAFAGPALAEAFYKHSTWRWAFGSFAIIVPAFAIPVSVILLFNQRKAENQGLLPRKSSGRTWNQSAWHYFVEFDVIGMIIICAGFSLFLLPFSLATHQANRWASADIIAMLVVGFVLLCFFPFYEAKFARKSFVPFRLLRDRTVLGSCVLAAVLFVSFYCWDGYFLSYLQVVWGMSIEDAGYMSNIYDIGSAFFGVIVGFLVRGTGRFKWIALLAVPLMVLGAGLLIHFRQPYTPIGYVVMCQLFISFAGGAIVITMQMAIMAAADHQSIAVVLALQGLFTSVGGAIGSSVAGAIWTNTLPGVLADALVGTAAEGQAETIYASLKTQLSYPIGDPVRNAIIYSYGVAQKDMCIASTAILVIGFAAVVVWRDIHVDEIQQVKGRVV